MNSTIKKRPRLQKGIYSYLKIAGLTPAQMRFYIKKYASERLQIKENLSSELKLLEIQTIISKDFEPFKSFVNQNM